MSSAVYQRVRANPQFKDLVARRGRFAWTLAIVVLVLFYGFVLLVAFNPTVLGQPLTAGGKLTLGVAFELFMFVFFWVLTALYVRRANTEFDSINQQILKDAAKGDQ